MTSKKQLPLYEDKDILPTGKWHVSFSELDVFQSCSNRHYLSYVKNLGQSPPNEYSIFGGCLHEICETYVLSKHLKNYDHQQTISDIKEKMIVSFKEIEFEDSGNRMAASLERIALEFPDWMDKQFPGWVLVAAELQLFESIQEHTNKFFKGYVDLIIKTPKVSKRVSKKINEPQPIEWEVWVLDLKSCSWGWTFQQKTSKTKIQQLALYKKHISNKLGIELKNIKCGFILCKRTAKLGNSVLEFVPISVGPKTIDDVDKEVDKMLTFVSKGWTKKNKDNCQWCPFKNDKEICSD